MKYKLADVLKNKTQGVNTTTDKIKYVDIGYKIVQAKNIEEYNVTFDENNYIDEETFNRVKENHKLHKGDVLYTNIGSQLGNSALYNSDEKAIITWNVMKLIPNEKLISSEFLCYLLNYNKLKIKTLNSSSTMPFVSGKELMNFEINIPALEIQNKITKILNMIQSKIRLNNQINDNLLKFGLGLITEEMKKQSTKELRSIIKFIKGKKPINISETKKDKYLSYLTIANLNNQENLYACTENVIIADNDLLMVMDGASSGDVYYSDYGIVGSTLAKIDIIDTSYNQASIYFILKYFNEYIKSKNTGSAIPHTDKEIVYKLVIPDIDNQKEYENILKNILQLNKQNKMLEQLRDTLLPKLMNGEIDLDKIEI